MTNYETSTLIKKRLHKGFEDGTSKMAQRKYYGYIVNQNGELKINPAEVEAVRFIFIAMLTVKVLAKMQMN